MTAKHAALALLALAYLALIPGITLPVIEMSGALEKKEVAELGKQLIADKNSGLSMFSGMASKLIDGMNTEGQIEVYRQKRSIMETVRELAGNGHLLVAFLVALFSVVVPVIKGALTVYGNVGAITPQRLKASRIASAISKWSMADVFVIAIFIAFLAARATQNSNELVRFDADFGQGFYFFGAYCILSIASASLMPRRAATTQDATAPAA
ncbi:MAG: paraquat-inducible protein A [Gammaproteobacteria bacterium]